MDNHEIPSGVDVGVSAYVLHHNPDIFPEYRPERWIELGTVIKQDI